MEEVWLFIGMVYPQIGNQQARSIIMIVSNNFRLSEKVFFCHCTRHLFRKTNWHSFWVCWLKSENGLGDSVVSPVINDIEESTNYHSPLKVFDHDTTWLLQQECWRTPEWVSLKTLRFDRMNAHHFIFFFGLPNNHQWIYLAFIRLCFWKLISEVGLKKPLQIV